MRSKKGSWVILLIQQMWRFSLVGVIGFVINAGLVEGISHVSDPIIAQGIGFPAAATVTWWFNRKFTFKSREAALRREWLQYMFASLGGWVVNNGAYFALIFTQPWAYRRPVIAVAAGSLAGMCANFFATRYLVFGAGAAPRSADTHASSATRLIDPHEGK